MFDVIDTSQRVERGAALLDERLGLGWPERVDLETLRIGSCYTCTAAQATGLDYAGALPLLFGTSAGWADAPDYGFALHPDEGCELACDNCEQCDEAMDLLQSAWVGLITVRRSRAKAGA